MQFKKVHGLGNDFVLIDSLTNIQPIIDWGKLAVEMCNRNFGVGADGLVVISASAIADIKMRIFNPDGTEPEMCGNAIRTVAGYICQHHILDKRKITVETKAGILVPEIIASQGTQALVKVDMGPPRLEPAQIPMIIEENIKKVINYPLKINGETIYITCISMGNPHGVIFVPEVTSKLVSSMGPTIENHPAFPNKTNVEFVQVLDREHLKMLVWERGAGPTMACGTGACATLVAAYLNDLAERKATVHLAGGDLEIEWAEDNRVYMTGPAIQVFSGNYQIKV
ncbi:MAG: diaminopimelate epimerase [Clostridia bacterium]|nr:diaminopimelate epimerase [Clostridia bacterium]